MAEQDERAKFEAWAREQKPPLVLTKVPGGAYKWHGATHAWGEWQARAAISTPAQPAPLRCDGCGKTMAEHDRMARCPTAQPAAGEAIPQHVLKRMSLALNGMLTQFGMDEDEDSRPTFDRAREAWAEAQFLIQASEEAHAKRQGFEWWDRLCALPRFSFILAGDSIRRLNDASGNWIEFSAAQQIVDDAQAEINVLRATPQPAQVAEPVRQAQEGLYSIDNAATLKRAVSLFEDVLRDIADWEDKALADAIAGNLRNLRAMVEADESRASGYGAPAGVIAWAVQQWRDEVMHRPLANVHRVRLDATWRKVIRNAGGDPEKLLGPEACSDDGVLLSAQAAENAVAPEWLPMSTAPKDGTMLRLLVDFEDHATEDSDRAPTIGGNSLKNTGEDRWQFAGWSWEQDCFTDGVGVPVGWLPLVDGAANDQRDAARLDWLETKTVNVRDPARYGSLNLFWATPQDPDDGEGGPSDIRAQIDAAISTERTAQTPGGAKP